MSSMAKMSQSQIRRLLSVFMIFGLLVSLGSVESASPRFFAQKVEMPVTSKKTGLLSAYKVIRKRETSKLIRFRNLPQSVMLKALSSLLDRKSRMPLLKYISLPTFVRFLPVKIIPSNSDCSALI